MRRLGFGSWSFSECWMLEFGCCWSDFMKLFVLIWSNLKRKKVRTILTLLSIVVACILFAVLSSIKQALTGGVRMAAARRFIVQQKASIIQTLPYSSKARMLRSARVARR